MDEQASELRVLGILRKSESTVTIYGLEVADWFVTTLYRRTSPISINVHVRVHPEAGPLPQGVMVNATPSSTATYKDALELMRGAPVDKLLHEALLMTQTVGVFDQTIEAFGKSPGDPLTAEEQASLDAAMKEAQARAFALPAPVRRRSVTRDLLTEVARVYRTAVSEGKPPTQAVSEHFVATHTTAARWVREARRAGVLGPAKGPTAGEADNPRSIASE